MTQLLRLHNPRRLRAHVPSALTVLSLAALTALAPAVLAGGTTIVVTALPGGGWIVSTDNTPGGSVELVPFTEPGTLGNGAIELTTAATADFAGVADPFFPVGIPYADLTTVEWRTFVSGDTGTPSGEAASLRLSGYQDGFSVFTTVTAELTLNGGATPDVWQDNTLSDSDNSSGRLPTTGMGSASRQARAACSGTSRMSTLPGDSPLSRWQSAPGSRRDELDRWRDDFHHRERGGDDGDVRLRGCRGSDTHPHRRSV